MGESRRRTTRIYVNRSVLESMLCFARANHPREGVLLVRGSIGRDKIVVEEVVMPPFSVGGFGFSSFPLHMLPVDFSIVGTAHSHPSGVPRPSITDLNKFYGRIMIIAAYPYRSEQDVAIFGGRGDPIKYEIVEDQAPT